jgi:putative DNA primase/helicase
MTVSTEESTLSSDVLTKLKNMGFKLIPLNENNRAIEPWAPIYDNPNYWTPEKIVEESYKFKNVATCFGKTHLRDTEGRELYLNCLDIDSQYVYDILFNLRNEDGKTYSLIPLMQRCSIVVKTRKPSGFHLYWLSHTQNRSIHTTNCKPGFDFEIKTDKSSGHGTLPPSKHRDDSNFQYANQGIDKLYVSDELYFKLIEALKECLVDKNESKKSFQQNYDGTNNITKTELTNEEITKIVNSISPYYKRPSRNSLVYGLCGLLHKSGISKNSTLDLIRILAKDDEEKRLRDAVVGETYNKNSRIVSGSEYLLKTLEHATNDQIIAKEILNKIVLIIGKGEDHIQWLTRQVMNEYTFVTTTDNEEMYYYDNEKGVYVLGAEWRIKVLIQLMRPKTTSHEKQEVINHIKDSRRIDRSEFDVNPDILNFDNGLLDIHTGEFLQHSHNHYSLSRIPVKYDPKARCPKFAKFLSQILKPKDVPIILQFIAYCLYKTSKYEKAVLCIGKGDNGKSTLLRALEHFFGKENISHVSLQDLSGGNRFASVDLFGKLVNTFADLKSDKLENTGPFKMIVSGDMIRAEKKHCQPFTFANYAKLWFSCNEIPESDDTGYAYFKRWIILHFEHAFTGEERDNNLIDKITTPEELSGLLNLALISLRQLIKDNGFIHTDDIETVKEDYNLNSSGVERFVMEKCEITKDKEDYTICRDLWGSYVDYCEENNIKVKDDNVFGLELLQLQHIDKDRITINHKQEYVYVGIKLKDN